MRVLLLRHHRKRSAKVKSSRVGKAPMEKMVGKLISGCVHLIEIIPTTFKYVTGFPFSPLRLSSSLLSSPLPHSARPVPSIRRTSPRHGFVPISALYSRDPHQVRNPRSPPPLQLDSSTSPQEAPSCPGCQGMHRLSRSKSQSPSIPRMIQSDRYPDEMCWL